MKTLAVATSCTVLLATATTVMAQNSVEIDGDSVRINQRGVTVESGDSGVNIRTGGSNTPRGRQPYEPSVEIDDNSGQNDRHQVGDGLSNDVIIIDSDEDETNGRDRSSYYEPQQRQISTISLNSSALRQPHILRVSIYTASRQLTRGQIKVDSRVVRSLGSNETEINLSPFLSKGRHTIEVLANNCPVNSSLQVEFSGPRTQVNQQTVCRGAIAQTLIVNVR